MTQFSDFALSKPLLKAVEDAGYEKPTKIQEKVIPAGLEGRDIIGCSQTGTGKTAAFLLPILEGLLDLKKAPRRFRPYALVLSPTRELAQQVGVMFDELARHTRHKSVVLYGGVGLSAQDQALDEGPSLVVATPGRLLEHLRRGGLTFDEVRWFVIDEADRMLDPGFIEDIRKIADHVPPRRQTMLFSATIAPEMDRLARGLLIDPERIQIGLIETPETLEEQMYPVAEHQKIDLLKAILEREKVEKAMVFVRRRVDAAALAPELARVTDLETRELHGDLSQPERNETIESFRSGSTKLLVATDVASRGIDVLDCSHVVNFNVPNTPDDYIHRAGRTGRVDRPGKAITLVSPGELANWASVEYGVRRPIHHVKLEDFEYDPIDEEVPSGEAGKAKTSAKKFLSRKPKGEKAPKPFTKSGQLAKEYRPKKKRKKKKEIRRLQKKKLPHER